MFNINSHNGEGMQIPPECGGSQSAQAAPAAGQVRLGRVEMLVRLTDEVLDQADVTVQPLSLGSLTGPRQVEDARASLLPGKALLFELVGRCNHRDDVLEPDLL